MKKISNMRPLRKKLKSYAQKAYTKATTKVKREKSKDTVVETPPENKTIFGVDLDELCKRENTIIPYFVLDAIKYLKETGSIDIVGIFRISGNVTFINEVKQLLDEGKRIDLSSFNFNGPHVVTGLLKMYFRQLPDPIVTHRYFEQFVQAANIVPEHKAVEKIKLLLPQLPQCHRYCLDFIINFCSLVTTRSDINKMTSKNISSLMGPNLLKRENPNPMKMLEDISNANKVVELLIDNYWEIFNNVNYDISYYFPNFSQNAIQFVNLVNDVVQDDLQIEPEETTEKTENESSTSEIYMMSSEDRGRAKTRIVKNERAIDNEDKPIHYRIQQDKEEEKTVKPLKKNSKENIRISRRHKQKDENDINKVAQPNRSRDLRLSRTIKKREN